MAFQFTEEQLNTLDSDRTFLTSSFPICKTRSFDPFPFIMIW